MQGHEGMLEEGRSQFTLCIREPKSEAFLCPRLA